MTRDDRPVDPLTPTQAEGTTLPAADGAERIASGPIGTYQLGEVIGRGGMGEVVLARDLKIGRHVALKRMRAAKPSAEAVDRFLREATIQAHLDHPAIAPVHELGHDAEGRPFFTMKRVVGTTLAELLESGTATLQRLLRGLVDVCMAIELAHGRGVIHRDLKPSNLMFGDYGEVYVLDWGVARVIVDDTDEPTTLRNVASLDGGTREGALLGTPGFMAPEQVRGEPVLGPADVYALGAILFEILAGEPLHPRGDAALALTLVPGDLSPARRAPARPIAPELDAACVAALAFDPFARPTARELGEAIQAYLDGDRDLERRRALAGDSLATARAALAAGDRGTAMQESGRALVLDPTSTEAASIAVSLVVAEPETLPAELSTALAAEEERLARVRSRRAIAPFLSAYLALPLLPMVDVVSWTPLVVLCAMIAVAVGALYANVKVGVPVWVLLFVHLVVIVAFSRVAGPFVLTPMLICAVLLAVTSLPWMNARRWAVITWTAAAALLPSALERIGLLGQSWSPGGAGLISHGTIFDPVTSLDATVAIVSNLAAILMVALYAHGIGRDRRDAQRRLYIQAWHLQHLLPRTTTALASA